MPKVLHIIRDMPYAGGAQRLVNDLCSLNGNVNDRVLVWGGDDSELMGRNEPKNVEVLFLRPFTISKFLKACKWIREADLLHIHLFPTIYLCALLCKPKVYTEHNTWNRRRKYNWLRPIERFVYKRYSAVIAISEKTKKNLEEWITPQCVPISIISNGISIQRFYQRERILDKQKPFTIGMVSRFASQKDQDCLIRALQHLPPHINIKFAGDGPRLGEVQLLAKRMGVEDRVKFYGVVKDIPKFLDTLDIYVQSSHWEGFGLTVVEAMASGLPTIASDVEGMCEVIGNPDFLFQKSNEKALSKLLLSISSDEELYQKASLICLQRAQNFSIEKTSQEYQKIYEKAFLKDGIK